MTTNNRLKIIIADDHTLFRKGLCGLLCVDDNFEVVAEASDGLELLELLNHTTPDIILLDIDMPNMNGYEAAKHALSKNPDLKIITLSMHCDQEYYFQMVSIGVKGFLLKSSDFEEVSSAINIVAAEGNYFSQELLGNIVGHLSGDDNIKLDQDMGESLSLREQEILLLICQGFSNVEIADKLFISKRTVDKHRANILAKTNCKNTANLVMCAIRNKLIDIF